MTPESFTTTRHRCTHCRRSWSKLSAAQAHLDRGCRKDPNAHACATCAHEYIGQRGYTCEKGIRPEDAVIVMGCTGWAAHDGDDE